MECPLCGAENSESSACCQLCDEPLRKEQTPNPTTPLHDTSAVVKTIDTSKVSISPRKVGILAGAILFTIIPWVMMWNLFTVPKDVLLSRQQYNTLKSQYENDIDTWSTEKIAIIAMIQSTQNTGDMLTNTSQLFDRLPLEVGLAYLLEDLHFGENSRNVALYPNTDLNNPTFVLSKYQKGVWPLKILVSVELRLRKEGRQWIIDFQRLRRGGRDINTDLASEYFKEELQQLRALEGIKGGLESFALLQLSETEESNKKDSLLMSWSYRRRPSLPIY